jgi:cellulose biosynthesis protein BcsQ
MSLEKITARQAAYYDVDTKTWSQSIYADKYPNITELLDLHLPKKRRYAVCNLRGGIGKSTLTYNLAYETNNLLVIDTCPQGNASAFFNEGKPIKSYTNIYEAILPYMLPRLPFPANISTSVAEVNNYFKDKNIRLICSSPNLYEFPTILESALSQANNLPTQRDKIKKGILSSLKDLIDREAVKANADKVIIDTSPFFSGATHLSWHAVEALIVPVRTDQQSVDSLLLLIDMLKNPMRSFQRSMEELNLTSPKIQMVVVTHCGWSTRSGAKHEPNNQTKIYLEKVYEVVCKNLELFTTNEASNHIVPLDDFLGSGRIASAKAMPIKCMKPLQRFTIGEQTVEVNESVTKCQRQLSFIGSNIWGNE